MQRKKILWLVSWYPNKNDWFDGDFIQRHARAAAIYHMVHVIFVTDAEIKNEVEERLNYVSGLTEQIIYFKKRNGFFNKIKKQWKWKSLYQKAVKKYIEKNGLPDCVHVHVPWKAGLIALWMRKKYKTQFIITEHWGIYNNVVDDNFFTKPKFVQNLLKKIYTEASGFVTVSNFLARGVKEFIGKKCDVIIPNVVDTTLFFYKGEKYLRFTFIHVSNMVALKNAEGILLAFKEVADKTFGENIQLIMIGNRNDEYVKLAIESGLLNKSVFFKGEISYTQVAEEMRSSHCFVLNSVMENSPCVIAEALCCGLPVITTDVGGIPELVYKTNSRLIFPDNVKALVKVMEEVLHNYGYFNQREISEEASKKFSYLAIAQKFDELYKTVC